MKPLRVAGSVALALMLGARAPVADESTLSFARFGTVHLYRGAERPAAVVLFVSGDGGWNLGVVDMARELATLGALVIGIDVTHYLRELAASDEHCLYPAAEFEALSQFVQKQLGLPTYTTPVLVGYSSGATLVYAVAVQAPVNTFRGAISLGFCPDLALDKPLCRGNGLEWTTGAKGKGTDFLPARTLSSPWVALQGTIDQVCLPAPTQAFVAKVPGAEIVLLPKVGHGYSVPRNWLPQFRGVFQRLTAPAPTLAPSPPVEDATHAAVTLPEVADLPVVELPASGGELLAVMISGDGGWAGIDREVGGALVAAGISVVGLDSLRYFWTARTPEQTAADVARVARRYLAAWHLDRFLLAGYSRGADVLPFVANRLPPELRARLSEVALLGPSERVEFEFHVADWVSDRAAGLATEPEARRLGDLGVPLLCFYGEDETDSLCPRLTAPFITVPLPHGHHFGGRYEAIAARMLRVLAPPPAGTPSVSPPLP